MIHALNRSFTTKEKAGLLILSLILLALAYYYWVDRPVRQTIAEAEEQKASLEAELNMALARAARYRKMAEELSISESGSGRMPSYNGSKEEIALLNGILEPTRQYSVSFSAPVRNGDLIRRGFTLQFQVDSLQAARSVVAQLSGGDLRCLLGSIACSTSSSGTDRGSVSVRVAGNFFETMVGGVPDAGLPPDTAKAS